MTSLENSCKPILMWQIVDNMIYKTIDEAREQLAIYRNRKVSCYIETIGNGFKIVFGNHVGQEAAVEQIHNLRQTLKGLRATLEMITIE